MKLGVFISLAVYMIIMLWIGYWAYKRTASLSDYMLGGRNLGPIVTALSAGAADMSGWLLMGVPGAMYATGLPISWIAVGLIMGAYINYLVVAPRLRVYTEVANNSITIPDYLENRFQDKTNILRTISASVIFIFFTLYISAGLVSGGKLFESAFHLNYEWGLFITAGVIICYTLFGGFLAVSWTDAVQGTIMFIALLMVPIVTLLFVGGITPALDLVKKADPSHLDLLKGTTFVGIISLLAWGLGYFGQPHIIVRFMAIKSIKELKRARRIGIGWMVFTMVGALLTGFFGLAYYLKNQQDIADPETIFIELSNILFHPLVAGFLLAAILAAIMSTISSQLLVVSSSVTEDFYKTFFRRQAKDKELVLIGRISVLIVAIIAFMLAIHPQATILKLVGYAWSGFGSAFGPVILLSLLWKRMTWSGALAGMVVGALTVILWIQAPDLKKYIFEMIPGFSLSLLSIVIVSLLDKKPVKEVENHFEQVEDKLKAIHK